MISGPDTEFFPWRPTSLARLSTKPLYLVTMVMELGNGEYYKRRRMLFPAQRILTFQERTLGT
jgi:hypothetical protein